MGAFLGWLFQAGGVGTVIGWAILGVIALGLVLTVWEKAKEARWL